MPDTPKNDFLPFGIETGANVLKPDDYEGLAARQRGFVSGVAKSEELNTVWRQASVIAATFAQYIADRTGKDVLDDGDMAALLLLTKEALNAVQSISAGDKTHQPDADGNVQLGSAAGADIVTSMTDTTAGRVPVVGWMGLSKAINIPANTNTDLAEFFKTAPGAFYHCDNATQYANAPSWFGTTWFDVIATIHEATNYRTLYAISGNGNTAFAVITGGNFSGWKKDYTEVQKPTAADCDAVSATNGGTFQKPITVKGNGANISLQTLASGMACYLIGKDYNGDNSWYVGRGGANYNVSLYSYKGLNGVILSEDGSVSINPAQGKPVNVNGTLQLGTTKKLTIESQNSSTLGAVIHLWGNVDRPTVIEFGDDTSYHFYSQRNKDGSISFVSPGEIVPGNYTNFDSRYLGKNSTLTRLGAQVAINVPNNATVSAPAGCVQSGVRCGSNGALAGMEYRPLQILVNGTWVNVQSL